MDYQKIKFKAGLEIHQQLNTKKLFCDCPSILRKDEPDYEIHRKLHAVAGESGEVDLAAEYQAKLNKEFVYQGYDDTICLVELDEEPPHKINQDALEIAMQIALLLNCKILPITQIMRKTVIDGSNTTGFQRTTIIGYGGYLETSLGKVGIDALMLEEDAARIIQRGEKKEVYRLDRLGIPLVEVVTSPDIKTPEHAREVALMIGDILRSCDVKRGLGTIRQDISISVYNGNRVELKGVQDIDLLPLTVKNEVERQLDLEKKNKPVQPEVRNALADGFTEFLRPMPGAARMYPETDVPLLKISKGLIDKVKKNLPKLKSEVEADLIRQGLTQDMIKELFKRGMLNEYKSLFEVFGNANLIGKLIFMIPKEIASKENKSLEDLEEIFTLDVFNLILEKIRDKGLDENRIKEVLMKILSGIDVSEAVKFEKVNLNEIEEEVMKLIKNKPGLNPNAYMGLVMKEFKNKLSGKEAMEIINKLLK
jgi:Glu-tRNA(Gln) amidotransferase subunit E-like FAD-binding protein